MNLNEQLIRSKILMGLESNKFLIKEDYNPEAYSPRLSEVKKKLDNRDVEMIKKFQDWLDTRTKWVFKNGKFETLKKKSPGYGEFGPSTTEAYKVWLNDFVCWSQVQTQPSNYARGIVADYCQPIHSKAEEEWDKYQKKKLPVPKDPLKGVSLLPRNEGEKIYYMYSFVKPDESSWTEPFVQLWERNKWPVGDINSPNWKKFASQIATPVEWMSIFPYTVAKIFDPNYTKYPSLYQKWKKYGKTAKEAEMSMIINGRKHKFSDFNKINYSVTSDYEKLPGMSPEEQLKKSLENEDKMAAAREELQKGQIERGEICVPCHHPDNPPNFDNTGICQGSVWCDPNTRARLLDRTTVGEMLVDPNTYKEIVKEVGSNLIELLPDIETVMNAIRELLNGNAGSTIQTILNVTQVDTLGFEILRCILVIWDYYKEDWYNFIGSLINALTAGKIAKFIGSNLKNLGPVKSLQQAFINIQQKQWYKDTIGQVITTITQNLSNMAGWLRNAANFIDELFGTSWAGNSIDFVLEFARQFITGQIKGEVKSQTKDAVYQTTNQTTNESIKIATRKVLLEYSSYTTTNESIRSATRKVLLEYSRQRKYVLS